jgi:hypothetical protein
MGLVIRAAYGSLVGLSVMAALVSCKPRNKSGALDGSVASVASASASTMSDQEMADKLEEAFNAAEKAHPEGLPPCGPGVKGPCEARTSSDIANIVGNDIASQGDKLPPAIHNHDEALRGAYVAPDGTEFLVGYNYTGVPGPDTGVVYRKDKGGEWKIVYSKRENELGHLFGRSANDVWAAGVKTLAHWDGTAWKEETITGLDGNVAGVWGNDKELYVVGGPSHPKGDGGRIYHRDAAGAWTVDGHAKSFLFGVGGAGDVVYAVGQDGQILRRAKAGTWTDEGTSLGTNEVVYAAGPKDIYVAGSSLLHSNGDGTWQKVTLPTTSQPRNVWGRSSSDVYAGTLDGLYHLQGGTWRATAWHHEVGALAGNATTVLLANQRMLH